MTHRAVCQCLTPQRPLKADGANDQVIQKNKTPILFLTSEQLTNETRREGGRGTGTRDLAEREGTGVERKEGGREGKEGQREGKEGREE